MRHPVILWYRDDLRILDHAALAGASSTGAPVIPLYIHDEHATDRPLGGASRWWLHHSLASLESALAARGSSLLIRRGDPVDVLEALAAECGADAVYYQRHHEPRQRETERRLAQRLGNSLALRTFTGDMLYPPETVRTTGGDPFRVFTPFWKACLRLPEPAAPLPAPAALAPPPAARGLPLDALGLLPTGPDWTRGLRENWAPGEPGALARLEAFLDDCANDYRERRDFPGERGTSMLSPHLHFGELSPRQVWHAVRERQYCGASPTGGADAFLRELGWREFCRHLLYHWPGLPEKPFNPKFEAFPWRDDETAFHAWTRGETGYPLVDAGMRELWHTGWMHNRVRMTAASLLVKHLLVPWQRGEAWFRDTLVDADLANNVCGWQWVAGCGADAAPYFRIFNPLLQGEKFDRRGTYVRRWLPELARLPDRYIHRPFAAPARILSAAGVELGEDYPAPIIDHDFARRRALEAFKAVNASK